MQFISGTDDSPIFPLDHLSFSTLYWLLEGCLYKFYKKKLSGESFQYPETQPMRRGTSFHAMIEHIVNMNTAGHIDDSRLIELNSEQPEPLRDFMLDALCKYIVYNDLKGKCEYEFIWHVDRIPIHSFIDFISGDIINGEYEIFDWKTSSRMDPINHKSAFQTIVYQLAVQELFKGDIVKQPEIYRSSVVLFVPRMKDRKVEIRRMRYKVTPEQLEYTKRELICQINYFILLKKHNIWPKVRSKSCNKCIHRLECSPYIEEEPHGELDKL